MRRGAAAAVRVTALGGAAWAGFAGVAHACAVCFGPAGEPMIEGTKAAMLFMMGLLYLLLGAGVTVAMVLRRNCRRAAAAGAAPRKQRSTEATGTA